MIRFARWYEQKMYELPASLGFGMGLLVVVVYMLFAILLFGGIGALVG